MSYKFKLYDIFIHITLFVFIVVIFLLIKQNRTLHEEISGKIPSMIQNGDSLTSLYVSDLNGIDSLISPSGENNKLIFIFSNSCPHCRKTLPVWEKIFYDLKDSCNIFAVSVEPYNKASKKILASDFPYKIFFAKGDNFKREHHIIGVPLTLFVDKSGKVINSWLGELDKQKKDEIIKFIRK